MKASHETSEFIWNTVMAKDYGNLEDSVMEEIYKIGVYHGAFSEENFGEHCRRNSVYGFLETLVGLVK